MNGFGISIYGKGGIGKSTISANLACALAENGAEVLLVGCDPKHDTVRPISYTDVPTVTEYSVTTLPSQRRLDDILIQGRHGIKCIEAGGPRPGIGCAGKGIVTTFQIMDRLNDGRLDSDYVIYDVLGDVVCGGFSYPMRPSNTDMMFVVTSGEPMSLYAANNILKGSLEFCNNRGRIGGLILNKRGMDGESDLVDEFSRAIGIPIVAVFDRSGLFIEAERSRTPVYDLHPESTIAKGFKSLAETIHRIKLGHGELYTPSPLTPDEFDRLMTEGCLDRHGTYVGATLVQTPSAPAVSRLKPRRIGKGGPSAIKEAARITDIPVIIHGTEGCSLSGYRAIMSRRIYSNHSFGTGRNLHFTLKGPQSTVFGGCTELERTIETVAETGEEVIIVISTCVSNMIGEDVSATVEKCRGRHPDSLIILIEASRVDAGYDAHMEVLERIAGLVDPHIPPESNLVTIVDDTFLFLERGMNLEYVDSLLSDMGLMRIRGLLEDCNLRDVIELKRANIAMLGENRRDNHRLRDILELKGMRFIDSSVPKGIRETIEWINEIGSVTGRTERAKELIEFVRGEYDRAVERASESIRDRSVAVIHCDDSSVDWIVDALTDSKAEVTIIVPSQGYVQNTSDLLCGFDLVIGDPLFTSGYHGPHMPMPETTFTHMAQIDLLRRIGNLMRSTLSTCWMEWRDVL